MNTPEPDWDTGLGDVIKAHLESRRADPDFRQRLKARVEADREILKRLEEPEAEEGSDA